MRRWFWEWRLATWLRRIRGYDAWLVQGNGSSGPEGDARWTYLKLLEKRREVAVERAHAYAERLGVAS